MRHTFHELSHFDRFTIKYYFYYASIIILKYFKFFLKLYYIYVNN